MDSIGTQQIIGLLILQSLFVIFQNKAYDYKQNQTHIHTNVHTKGLQILMAECTQSFLSSPSVFNSKMVTA